MYSVWNRSQAIARKFVPPAARCLPGSLLALQEGQQRPDRKDRMTDESVIAQRLILRAIRLPILGGSVQAQPSLTLGEESSIAIWTNIRLPSPGNYSLRSFSMAEIIPKGNRVRDRPNPLIPLRGWASDGVAASLIGQQSTAIVQVGLYWRYGRGPDRPSRRKRRRLRGFASPNGRLAPVLRSMERDRSCPKRALGYMRP